MDDAEDDLICDCCEYPAGERIQNYKEYDGTDRSRNLCDLCASIDVRMEMQDIKRLVCYVGNTLLDAIGSRDSDRRRYFG